MRTMDTSYSLPTPKDTGTTSYCQDILPIATVSPDKNALRASPDPTLSSKELNLLEHKRLSSFDTSIPSINQQIQLECFNNKLHQLIRNKAHATSLLFILEHEIKSTDNQVAADSLRAKITTKPMREQKIYALCANAFQEINDRENIVNIMNSIGMTFFDYENSTNVN